MKKIKVGYLPLYIKLYDDSDPHYRDPMVRYMHTLIDMLTAQGIEVVEADEICRVKEEFDRAAAKFNDADVDAVAGATMTAEGLIEATQNAIAQAVNK